MRRDVAREEADAYSKSRFATTCWTLVFSAQASSSARVRSRLYRQYWGPVAAFLAGLGAGQDAEDVTQGFFMMLEKRNDVLSVDPARGRFRSWLRTCARNYLGTVRARNAIVAAGGRATLLSIDAPATGSAVNGELREELDPEVVQTQKEALAILDSAQTDLRKWYEARGKRDTFFELVDSMTERYERGENPDTEQAERLGITPGALRQERLQMRRRFARYCKAELRRRGVAEYQTRKRLAQLEQAFEPNRHEL